MLLDAILERTSAKIQCTQLSAVSNPQDVKTRFLGELIVYPCSVVIDMTPR